MSKILIICLGVMLMIATGCKKEGVLIQNTTYAQISANFIYSADAVYYELSVNNKVLEDSLLSQGDRAVTVTSYIQYESGKNNRLQLKELSSGAIVLDTLISLTGRNFISFLQLSAGDKPFITGGDKNEEEPPLNDSVKVRFIYTTNDLPDSIYLKMYYSTDLSTITPVDHPRFSFARNNFSRYFTLSSYNTTGYYYAFEIYNAANDVLIQKAETDPTLEGFLDGFLINTYIGGMTNLGQFESYLLNKSMSYTSPAAPNYFHYGEQYLYSQK